LLSDFHYISYLGKKAYRISLRLSQTGTTQTAGARNKGGNCIGQLCTSVVPH